ncbi:MAG: sugar ABC transporter permease [Atopostipes suicloacalis]|nr:sugar ABC transporter permease [Atopostipes suicloacalis]
MIENIKSKVESYSGYLFIAPQLLLMVFFIIMPVIKGFQMSFFEKFGRSEVFVGLENYKFLLNDPIFRRSIYNTIFFIVAIVFLTITFALFVSTTVFDKTSKYLSFIRTSYYLPVMVSMLVMSVIWKMLLNPSSGVVTWLLGLMGFEGVNLLGNPDTVMPVVVFVTFVGNVGQAILIYIAAMIGIPKDYFEAAELDGASRFQRIRHIIVPNVKTTTIYLVITNVIAVLKIFVVIQQLTGGGPNNASVTMMYYVYQNAFVYNRGGVAAAIGVMMFVIALVFSIPQMRTYLKED